MKQKHPFICICILIAIILCACILSRTSVEGFSQQHTIPAIIWTYWNSTDIPEVVLKCIDSWRHYNPEYEVRVVTPANFKEYVNVDIKSLSFIDGPARESDTARLLLLEKYGGVWSDASILLTKPYSFSRQSEFEFIGYYIDGFTSDIRYPVLENWFFATIPKGQFITKWKKAFFMLEDFDSVNDAVEYMKQEEEIDTQKIATDLLNYLFMHIAAQYVLQNNPELVNTMKLMKAEDGPFKYISSNGWDTAKALEDLCKGNHKTDIIKFRGGERNLITERKDLYDCIFNS